MIQQSVSKEKGEKVDKGLRGWGGGKVSMGYG